jgi:hypothetical protein
MRLGRAIETALKGQPSECEACYGSGQPGSQAWLDWLDESQDDEPDRRPPPTKCPDCQGTGHNLSGYLPPVEVNPQLLRRMTEEEGGFYDEDMAPWLVSLGDAPGGALASASGTASEQAGALELLGPDGVDARTRVTPRGEHGDEDMLMVWCESSAKPSPWRAPDGTLRHDRRMDLGVALDRLPRWRRGELLHARQRRERATRRQVEDLVESVAEATDMPARLFLR